MAPLAPPPPLFPRPWTLSKSVTKGKYHGCFYINEDGTRRLIDKKD